jgi:fructose-bisphosphate aldolase class I
MNAAGPHPWALTFSFSRAIQDPVLETWRGNVANVAAAQEAFGERARENGLASLGQLDGRAT